MQGYPLRAGEGRGIPLNEKMLPQYLKDLGYVTRLIGKWHVGYYTKYHTPTYRGFDSFFGYYNGYIQYYNHTITQNLITGYDIHRDLHGSINAAKVNGYFTDLLSEEAEYIIRNHDTSQPLFLQVNHLAPHSSDGIETMEVRDENIMNARFGYIKDEKRRRFASMMHSMDESIGRIVASLKNADMLKNSIIMFMSDNGAQTQGLLENFGSNYPLRGLKFTLFEGGIRGVACLYSPLIKQSGRVINQLIHVTDWLPTLYAAAGGNSDELENIDGQNQWPVLQNIQSKARDFVLLNIDEVANLEGAVLDRFKLVKGAKKLYGQYFGDDGQGPENPNYDINQILNSPTHNAIGKMMSSSLSPNVIHSLRSKSGVTCKKVDDFPHCYKRCLFDIVEDPCETKDVSHKYPEIVKILEDKIDEYRLKLVEQPNTSVDPAAFPYRFQGFWMPWIECQNCSYACLKQHNSVFSNFQQIMEDYYV